MATLIYAANMSLDGYTETRTGAFDWAEHDPAVFAFTTEIMRSAGTYLYGRRMYETMAVWETDPSLGARSELLARFADAWKAADKIVHSSTLASVPTARTRIERRFDASAVRKLVASSSRDVLVGGPHLAAQAFEAGLAIDCHLIVWPVVLGGRNPALPTFGRVDLELVKHERIGDGVVHLHYRTRSA
ncbi:MAG: dihydrofolate reductase family protein [Polyangiaceae bacterium]